MEAITEGWVDEWPRDMAELARALLRRGVKQRDANRERCSRCHRTPLVGERVYVTEGEPVICALCRSGQAELPSRVVRGPGSPRAIRVVDRHAA